MGAKSLASKNEILLDKDPSANIVGVSFTATNRRKAASTLRNYGGVSNKRLTGVGAISESPEKALDSDTSLKNKEAKFIASNPYSHSGKSTATYSRNMYSGRN